MDMEAWDITKYESPYLAIADVRYDPETGEVLVKAEGNEYVIEHGDEVTAQDVATRLDALRQPTSAIWKELLVVSPNSAWRTLLENMDYLGLLRDAVHAGKDRRDGEISKLRASISTCVEQVLLDVRPAQYRELLAHVRTLSQHFLGLTCDLARHLPLQNPLGNSAQRPFSSPAILELENFYQQVAMVQALYQRGQAPLSLVCCTQALLVLQKRLAWEVSDAAMLDELLGEFAGGAYATVDAQRHLNGLAEYLVSGVDVQKARRFCTAEYEPKECLTGIEFMLEVERVAREVSSRVGTPKYLQALESEDAGLILVHGRYLQDYHVTGRFPEMITAILPKRLHAPLRAKAFKYYAEEIGHDILEYQSCRELGLSDEQIQRAQPLPLHYAYVDVFTHLGELDPVVYAVSIFITEGMLGVDSPLDEPYKRLVGEFMTLDKHVLLNEKYHHTSIPRLFMAEVKAVSPAIQRLAMDYMLLVLELNYRAWDDLLDHYQQGDQRFLRVLPKVDMAVAQG
jgi:hypothetical protein